MVTARDLDLRGKGKTLTEAFKRTGVSREEFKVNPSPMRPVRARQHIEHAARLSPRQALRRILARALEQHRAELRQRHPSSSRMRMNRLELTLRDSIDGLRWSTSRVPTTVGGSSASAISYKRYLVDSQGRSFAPPTRLRLPSLLR